tara:strand:+ start:220 stop:612 length:393 start_codon:yes stop_codon:yes gene_type:complete
MELNNIQQTNNQPINTFNNQTDNLNYVQPSKVVNNQPSSTQPSVQKPVNNTEDDLRKIKEGIINLSNEVLTIKTQLALLLKDNLETKPEEPKQVEQKPKEEPESLLKAKNGDFQSDDVKIEDFFYVGNKR